MAKGGPHKSPMEAKVHAYIDKHYQRKVTGFICHSAWEKNKIPLKAIAWHNRPGGRSPSKVDDMVERLKGGWKPKRVVLVDPGSKGKMVVVDGYHRLAGLHAVGQKKVKAYVGTPRPGAGDWRQDILSMQQQVLNASGSQNSTRAKGAYASRDSDEASGARQRPMNVIQVPISPQWFREGEGEVVDLVQFTPLEVTGELPLGAPVMGDSFSPPSVPQTQSTYYGEDGVSESSSFASLADE